MDGTIKYLALLLRPIMHRCDHVIHIKLYAGEAIQGVGRNRPCLEDLGDDAVPGHRKPRADKGVCHVRKIIQ